MTLNNQTVVYIGGYGRSGSTLLDLVLGSHPQILSTGGLVHARWFWTLNETLCSCGVTPQACPFWNSVWSEYRVLAGQEVPDNIAQTQRRVESQERLPLMLVGMMPAASVAAYKHYMISLLEALARTSGKPYVVDSSKTARNSAWRPLALHRFCGRKVRVIYMLRDVRGVMWSQKKMTIRNGASARSLKVALAPLRALAGWAFANLNMILMARLLPRGCVLPVRYEDFTANPERELTRIGQFIDLDMGHVMGLIRSNHPITAEHMIAGNRLRLDGVQAISNDLEWREHLQLHYQFLYFTVGRIFEALHRRSSSYSTDFDAMDQPEQVS